MFRRVAPSYDGCFFPQLCPHVISRTESVSQADALKVSCLSTQQVVWAHVRLITRDSELVSLEGTHLGHAFLDKSGKNRYCVNIVSVAGRPTALYAAFLHGLDLTKAEAAEAETPEAEAAEAAATPGATPPPDLHPPRAAQPALDVPVERRAPDVAVGSPDVAVGWWREWRRRFEGWCAPRTPMPWRDPGGALDPAPT